MTKKEALYNLEYLLPYHTAIAEGELEGRTMLTVDEILALKIGVDTLSEIVALEEKKGGKSWQ